MGGVGGEDYYVPYLSQYFTIEALDSGTFTMAITNGASLNSVSYSTDDGESWVTTPISSGQNINITTPTIQQGGKVLWKCETMNHALSAGYSQKAKFSSTAACNIYGNIMSLIYNEGFVGKREVSSASYVFRELFMGLKVVDAKYMIIPISTAYANCFHQLFYGNTYVVNAPTFIIETVDKNSMQEMFKNCSSLNNVTIVSDSVGTQANMFQGVTTNGVLYKDGNWSLTVPGTWTVQNVKFKPL